MTPSIDNVVQLYGDLLFDLCVCVLRSPALAQNAFRTILKEIKRTHPGEKFQEHERAWILRVAFDKLKKLSQQHGRKMSSSEQIALDASPSVSARLKNLDLFSHRLTTEEQVILLLRDKYGLPYVEIATATGLPEGTLKAARQQALRALENWIWEDEAAEFNPQEALT